MAEKDVVVRDLLKSGQRLAAMNLYHSLYGGELAEVRANVEEMEADDGVTGYYPTSYRWEHIADGAFRDAVVSRLRAGDLIAAIRLCREQYPGPLKYAKQAVLAWRHSLGLEHAPTEAVLVEQVETFDLRWSITIHPAKHLLFQKRAEAFIEFRFELQVAEHSIPDLVHSDAVSWPALAASKASDGEYGIFTCGCGDMGCGGFAPIEVIHLDGRTLWYDRGRWNCFDEGNYKAAISRVEAALLELMQSYPGVPVKFVLDDE
jgi:hypothetical protein